MVKSVVQKLGELRSHVFLGGSSVGWCIELTESTRKSHGGLLGDRFISPKG